MFQPKRRKQGYSFLLRTLARTLNLPLARINHLYSPNYKKLWEIYLSCLVKIRAPLVRKKLESRYWGTTSNLYHKAIIVSFTFEHKNSSSTCLHKVCKWPSSSQHQRTTPWTSMGRTAENSHVLDLKLSCSDRRLVGLLIRTQEQGGPTEGQDVVLVISTELWIKLCLEPVLALCVSKVNRHRCLSIFVKIFKHPLGPMYAKE